MNTEIKARFIGSQSIICGGSIIHVDRTHDARAWCEAHGMTPEYTATADGERFTVYTGTRYGMTLACAIPA